MGIAPLVPNLLFGIVRGVRGLLLVLWWCPLWVTRCCRRLCSFTVVLLGLCRRRLTASLSESGRIGVIGTTLGCGWIGLRREATGIVSKGSTGGSTTRALRW